MKHLKQRPEKPLDNPNLPENEVTAAAVGAGNRDTIDALIKLDIRPVIIPENSKLPDYLKSHADLSIFHLRKNTLFFYLSNMAGEFNNFSDSRRPEGELGMTYPDDCRFNCVSIGNNLICNTKVINKEILNAAEESGMNIIHCNQGYTKCSVCPVTGNSFITDDESIYKSAQNFFNDVLLITKGSIRLRGKDYGFIGGATGKIGKNNLAVNGRLESHKDSNLIMDFLDKYNIKVTELTDKPIEDIGSIIPLYEAE